MAQNDIFKRYLDAGMAFTQMTRSKAEDIVRDWVKAGEVQRDQIQSQVDELIERSRHSTDQLVALIRDEVINQCAQLGLVSRDDLRSLQRRLMEQFGAAGRTGPRRAGPTEADDGGRLRPAASRQTRVVGPCPGRGRGGPRRRDGAGGRHRERLPRGRPGRRRPAARPGGRPEPARPAGGRPQRSPASRPAVSARPRPPRARPPGGRPAAHQAGEEGGPGHQGGPGPPAAPHQEGAGQEGRGPQARPGPNPSAGA